MSFKTLSAKVAAQVDQELMSTGGFSIDQLMELAGLSVAEAAFKSFPKEKKVLVLVGPGNNGGDGLVAARHLKLWGYQPSVYYPKPSSKPLFVGLETQLKNLEIEFINDLNSISNYQLIIDAIFGFSFKAGNIREPFKSVIDTVNKATQIPILSVDIPSGWDVDNGFLEGGIREPAVLVSLTAPKPVANCIDTTKTQHYVGGRFVGRAFAEKYGIDLYQYKGYDQVLKL
ncbi:CYFA0S10e01288g1_1 [Cyberlindnera fabianii]|uniref:NAD(P)H-hydrate epimerase n=1 Tax=Cyberlindnera fabianii TaxID=36022 RepID=A0A061AZP0_CYBFA|nr:CYFA0S10e01288g1_1 [Cyberlindnera fabianii]